MRAQLVLQELAESPGGTDESTERRPIEVMVTNAQPPSFVRSNEGRVDDEALDNVHQRILLEVPRGVIGLGWHCVPKFPGCDAERFQHIFADVRRERLTAGPL